MFGFLTHNDFFSTVNTGFKDNSFDNNNNNNKPKELMFQKVNDQKSCVQIITVFLETSLNNNSNGQIIMT